MSKDCALIYGIISHFFKRMVELQMRCQALQVRFEDQSASLKQARENHGDMKVCHDLNRSFLPNLNCPSPPGALAHSREGLRREGTCFLGWCMISNFLLQVKQDAETGKLGQEVFVLQERNAILQRSVDECRRQIQNQQESSMVTRNEYEKKLKDERDSSHTHIQALQGRMLQADLEKTQAIREAEDLRNSLATAQSDLLKSREQAQSVQGSLSAWDAQVKELTTQNHVLQTEKVGLLERNHNISIRYETNELVRCRTFMMIRILNSNGGRASKRRPL